MANDLRINAEGAETAQRAQRLVDPASAGLGARQWISAVGRGLYAASLFVRFPLIPFTVLVTLLGAASVASDLAGGHVAGLVAVALCYHVFAYVLNDVLDLEVDRSAPQRADFPLVRGTIGRLEALAIALLQFPLALALTVALGGSSQSYLALAAAFALMAGYNLLGKRLPFPPLTDMAQGLGWGALVLYGATLAGEPLPPLALTLAAFVATFVVMVNGVHASLRDVPNDWACRMRTTSLLLGVRPHEADTLHLPRRFRAYVLALQALLTALLVVTLWTNAFGYEAKLWVAVAAILVALVAPSWLLLARANAPVAPWRHLYGSSMLHIALWLTALACAFAPAARGELRLALLLAWVSIFLASGWMYEQLRAWWRRRPSPTPQPPPSP